MLPLLNAANIAPGSQPDGSGSGGVPATPDNAVTTAPEKNLKKVELDLDGAPFLEEEKPAEPAPKQEAAPTSRKSAGKNEEKPKKNKKKLILIAGIALLLLLGAGTGSWFIFFAEDKPDDEAVVITVPSGPILTPAPVDGFTIDLAPFWVELADNSGEMRLLICKVLIPTNSENNVLEINAKTIIVRDAIYYYLHNKDYTFLSDNTKMDEIKQDIVNIINEYLMTEKISEVLLDDYIIR